MSEATELKISSQLIGNKAYMLLNAPLGFDAENPEPYINGGTFAQRMYDLKSQGYHIVVKINSPGGMVTDGYSIIDAINTTQADTINIGLAASMAGMALLSGKKRSALKGTSLMAHAAAGGNSQFKEIVRTGLTDLMDKRTKMPKDKITEMMNGAGMHWFDDSEMLANGMVDEIIETDAKFIKPTTKNITELYKVYNSLTQTENNMLNDLIKGIWPGKSDAEVVTNALTLKTDNEALKVKNTTLEAEIVTLRKAIEDAGKVSKATEVKNLVDAAVKAGKIAEASRGSWEVMATGDMKSAKEALDSITKTKNTSAASIIKVEGKIEEGEKGTYAYLTKNDPNALAEIMRNDPEKFEKLLSDFEKAPKEIKK